MAKRFWPGYTWRILAHHKSDTGRKGAYNGERVELKSGDFPLSHVEFDELVIDHWFHLEQMDERVWWMDVAGMSITVTIDGNGRPTISMYEESTPDQVAEYYARWKKAA
jgi:hypothetical protein